MAINETGYPPTPGLDVVARRVIAGLNKSADPPKATPQPFCFKVLDISTAHLTEAECRDLESCALEYQTMACPEGGLLYISDEIDDPKFMRPEVMTETLLNILRYASSLGCHYVKFDADGAFIERLPVLQGDEK